MIQVRKVEQKKAASLGKFGALALLDYPSREVKDKDNEVVVREMAEIIRLSLPDVIYTHNLADKHDTHIGVVTKVIKAIRSLPKNTRPNQLLGCEVWRDLDWLNDEEKVYLDVSNRPDLASDLVEVFESQIIGGKRYDKAAIGRRLANATFSSSHAVDESDALTYAMDLTPLINNDELNVVDFISNTIDRFKENVTGKIEKMM
jgi:LmbE family N-acetylglucosaminyl deacetylase